MVLRESGIDDVSKRLINGERLRRCLAAGAARCKSACRLSPSPVDQAPDWRWQVISPWMSPHPPQRRLCRHQTGITNVGLGSSSACRGARERAFACFGCSTTASWLSGRLAVPAPSGCPRRSGCAAVAFGLHHCRPQDHGCRSPTARSLRPLRHRGAAGRGLQLSAASLQPPRWSPRRAPWRCRHARASDRWCGASGWRR